jgi:hypothetical protein
LGLVEVFTNICSRSSELRKTALGLLEANGDGKIVSVFMTLEMEGERVPPKYWVNGHPCASSDKAGWHAILEENGGYTHHLLDNEAKLKSSHFHEMRWGGSDPLKIQYV